MALSIPIEFCNYLLNRSGDCNKAKEADKLDSLELAKETIPTITCDAVQHSGKNDCVGTLLDGQLHGFCILKTVSYGFIGTFWDALRQGFGISLYSKDNLFMGFYEDDKYSGLGISLRGENEIDIGLWKTNCLTKANISAISRISFFESPIFAQYYNEEGKLTKEEIFRIPKFGALPPLEVDKESPSIRSVDFANELNELSCFQYSREKVNWTNQEFEIEADVPSGCKSAAFTLSLVSCVRVLSKTPFSTLYLAKIFSNEVKSNGPITRAVESLYWAAENNNPHGVREILTHTLDFSCKLPIKEQNPLRFDANLSDLYGITPMHVASANQSAEVVDFLLSYGADPNALTVNKMSPITICALSYLEKYSTEHKEGAHLIELGAGQSSPDAWSRAELVWLLDCEGSDYPASCDDADVPKIHSPDNEGYIETDMPRPPETVLHTRERMGHHLNPPRFNKYMSCNQYLEALAWDAVKMPTSGGLVGCKSRRPRVTSTSTEATQVTQTDLRGMRRSIRFRARLKTMLLLLQHGADPNIPTQPLPPLIAAARAGDVELARLLLHFGADPNIRIPRELVMMSKTEFTDNHGNVYEPSTGGLTALHFAVVLPGEVGVKLTQTLLQGGANPTLRALPDASFLVDIKGNKTKWPISKCDGGRTALHLACARTYDKQHSLKIVQLLMDHGADPNLLCNGQCALSLALICGNDEVVSLLLTYPRTRAGMGLTHGLGSPLCVVLHPVFEHVYSFDSRLALLSKLIAHCPSGLLNHRVVMPCETIEGNIVDYIHYAYTQVETKLLGDPAKRQILKNRHQILNYLAAELRKAVFASEVWKRIQDSSHTSSLMAMHELRFCFHCGRSVGVNLAPCRRCRLALFCSNSCRRGAWIEWHARQCVNTMARHNAEKVTIKAISGLEKQNGSQTPMPSTRNGHPAFFYGFYKDRIYMTKDAIERLLEKNFSSPGNYSFL